MTAALSEALEQRAKELDEAAARARPAVGARVRRFAPGGEESTTGRVIAVIDDDRALGGYVVLCRFWYPYKRSHVFKLAEGRDWGRGHLDDGRRIEIIEKKTGTKGAAAIVSP